MNWIEVKQSTHMYSVSFPISFSWFLPMNWSCNDCSLWHFTNDLQAFPRMQLLYLTRDLSICPLTLPSQVPHNTTVMWNREISIGVIRSSLPQDNANLLNFVQESYNRVTTFSEVADANTFTLLVGGGKDLGFLVMGTGMRACFHGSSGFFPRGQLSTEMRRCATAVDIVR